MPTDTRGVAPVPRERARGLRQRVRPIFCLAALLIACAAAPGWSGPPAVPATADLSTSEQELYDLLMQHRADHGLAPIPLSPSLTKVARIHVADLNDNRPDKGKCNMHSWSSKGKWSPCCYTSDHAQAKCMWKKPSELTSYPGNGYEISHKHSARATPAGALASWKSSPGHDNVILGRGIWDEPWLAVGVAVHGNYAVAWFGREDDSVTE